MRRMGVRRMGRGAEDVDVDGGSCEHGRTMRVL